MAGTECECKALELTGDMLELYTYWEANVDDRRPASQARLRGKSNKMAKAMFSHLVEQVGVSGYEGEEPYHTFLEKMEDAISASEAGLGLNFNAIETVKDLIHQNVELKQLMVCGKPFTTKGNISETARVLVDVFDMVAGEREDAYEEAGRILNKQVKKLACAE